MSLTRDIHLDPVRRSLAASLVSFAEQIGALIVAEGIEQLEELRTWQDLGAHAAQGYLLGRPGQLPVAVRSQVLPRAERAIARLANNDGSSSRRGYTAMPPAWQPTNPAPPYRGGRSPSGSRSTGP